MALLYYVKASADDMDDHDMSFLVAAENETMAWAHNDAYLLRACESPRCSDARLYRVPGSTAEREGVIEWGDIYGDDD